LDKLPHLRQLALNQNDEAENAGGGPRDRQGPRQHAREPNPRLPRRNPAGIACRSIIRIGVKGGNSDSPTAIGPWGAWIIGMKTNIGTITGASSRTASCCASCGLPQAAPSAMPSALRTITSAIR